MSRYEKLANVVMGLTNFLYTIPVIAFFGMMVPVIGIGAKPAIIALVMYGLLPIVRNTYVGIKEVDSFIIESARGMGSTDMQLLMKIQIPLAMPVMVAGFRTMTVMTISIATIAAFIGAGGLGKIIWRGITTYYPEMIFAGSIPVAILAVISDRLLGKFEKSLVKKIK